jgi:predicted DNA-binding protein with PD1-like motif
VITLEVREAELIETLTKQAGDAGITDAAIVALIGAVDGFTLSTMPPDDPNRDILTTYRQPAELSGTGEIVGGQIHIHATMAINGNVGLSGHLHQADVGAWFVRAYVMPVTA